MCHFNHPVELVSDPGELYFCDCGMRGRNSCVAMRSVAEQKNIKTKAQVSSGDGSSIEASPDSQPTHAPDDDDTSSSPSSHPCFAIAKECKRNGTHWIDPDFPHSDASLFGAGEPQHPEWQGTKWSNTHTEQRTDRQTDIDTYR